VLCAVGAVGLSSFHCRWLGGLVVWQSLDGVFCRRVLKTCGSCRIGMVVVCRQDGIVGC
jgi:hypothetical protein